MNKGGFKYLKARKKGILRKTGLQKKIVVCKKKAYFCRMFGKKTLIFFYCVSFAYKSNPLETLKKVVTDVVAEESFKLALKRSIDAAVGSAVEPLKGKLGGLDQYVSRVNKLEATISDLESQLSVARKESKYAMDKANDNEQYLSKYNLRFMGIEEKKDENCTDIIVEFCKNMLGIDMLVSTTDRGHRVGRKTEGKTRPIVVKFTNYSSKLTVCMQRPDLH